MKWNRFTIETITEAEDLVAATLAELGIQGVEIQDKKPLTREECQQMFVDLVPEGPKDDGIAYLSFYLDEQEDTEKLLDEIHQALQELQTFTDIGTASITSSQTEDKDWMNNWKQFFKSFTVGDILIKPTWEACEDHTANICIEIDPGISFGTGKHETTQLCIRQLEKYAKALDGKGGGWKVLDVGCGSGILSIVALKLGAAGVTGIDIDENCIVSAQDNMQVNHLDPSLWHFYCGNLTDDRAVQEQEAGGYEIVLANILADIIIPMAGALFSCLKPGGVLITSGIIDFKEQDVAKALESAGFELLETNRQGEWVNLTARRN